MTISNKPPEANAFCPVNMLFKRSNIFPFSNRHLAGVTVALGENARDTPVDLKVGEQMTGTSAPTPEAIVGKMSGNGRLRVTNEQTVAHVIHQAFYCLLYF